MILTENINIQDSILFLLSARETLVNIVEATEVEHKEDLAKYIFDEASDYEVMHMLMLGDLPEEKYNQESEMALFSILKDQMLEDFEIVSEAMGSSSAVKTFLNEIDSVYPEYSTARPILEFNIAQEREFMAKEIITEADIAAELSRGQSAAIILKRLLSKGMEKGAALALIAKAKAKAALATGGKVASAVGGKAKALGTAGLEKGKAAGKFVAAKGQAALQAIRARAPSAIAAAKAAITRTAGMSIAGGALAALAGYAAFRTYKRFFKNLCLW